MNFHEMIDELLQEGFDKVIIACFIASAL
jgi:hypothetical protein